MSFLILYQTIKKILKNYYFEFFKKIKKFKKYYPTVFTSNIKKNPYEGLHGPSYTHL